MVNARFVKPVDKELIVDLATRIKRIITIEENTLCGGFGNYVNDAIRQADISDVIIRNIGVPDVFSSTADRLFYVPSMVWTLRELLKKY